MSAVVHVTDKTYRLVFSHPDSGRALHFYFEKNRNGGLSLRLVTPVGPVGHEAQFEPSLLLLEKQGVECSAEDLISLLARVV